MSNVTPIGVFLSAFIQRHPHNYFKSDQKKREIRLVFCPDGIQSSGLYMALEIMYYNILNGTQPSISELVRSVRSKKKEHFDSIVSFVCLFSFHCLISLKMFFFVVVRNNTSFFIYHISMHILRVDHLKKLF